MGRRCVLGPPPGAPPDVIEGAQHRRHVAQWRPVGSPFLEATGRLSFEVHDPEAVWSRETCPRW